MIPAAFAAELRRRGGLLWLDGGQVRCRAPGGVLTEKVVAYLGRHKPAIVAALAEEAWRDPDGPRLAAAMAIFDAEPIEEADARSQRPLFDQEEGGRRVNCRSLPIATIKPGDAVTIHLRGRGIDTINAWGGEVVAVDGVAVRIKASWHRFTFSPTPAEGEKVIPWGRIARINVEAPVAEKGDPS